MSAGAGGNPFVLNIVELQNVVTSAAGNATATLNNRVKNIEKMVNFSDKSIAANTIGKYDATAIQVIDPMNIVNPYTLTIDGVPVVNNFLPGPTGPSGTSGGGGGGGTGRDGSTGPTGPTGQAGLLGPTGPAGAGNFAGVSENFTVAGGMGTDNKLIYSYDGVTWKGLGNPVFGIGPSACYAVTWNSNLWVVGGQDSANNGTLGHSPDGIRWTSDMSGSSTANLFVNGACYGIAYSSPIWLAVGFSGTKGVIASSTDGINWMLDISGTVTGKWNAVAINNNIWVAGGTSGTDGIVWHSTDGYNWTTDMAGSGNSNLFIGGSCYTLVSNGTSILAGGRNASNGVIAISKDSINWTSSGTTAFAAGVCNAIAWNSSLWVAAGSNMDGGVLAHSYDGITWVEDVYGPTMANMFNGGVCYTVAWNGTLWLAGGWDGFNAVVARSYDGIIWTTEFSGTTNPPNLLYGGACFALTARRACCGSSSKSSGGNVIYNDPWIQKYFIDAPPCIVFQKVTTSSTEINVPWIYPTQFPIGLVCSWIPVINTLSSTAKIDISGTMTNFTLLTDASYNYINYHNNRAYVTGIVLSNMAGTNGIEQRTFPGESSPRSVFVYHNTALKQLVDNSNNILKTWYSNCNPTPCISSIYLPSFVFAGPPGPPIMITFIFSGSSAGILTYAPPRYSDITDPGSRLLIIDYTLTYTSPGSTYRFYGPVPYALQTVDNNTQLTYNLTGVYPDSVYTMTAKATNSANLTGAASDISGSSLPLSPIAPLSGTIPFPDRYYTNGSSTRIVGSVTVPHLVNINTPWTSAPFSAPIHNTSQRGNLQPASTIATESVEIVNTLVTTQGPSVNLGGFPVYTVAPITVNNMKLTVDISDSYHAVAQDGFYLQANNILELETPIFVSSPRDYTVTISQIGSFSGSKVFTYQYDNPITTVPDISEITFKLDSSVTYRPVSGVNVIYGTPSFVLRVVTKNMGNFYYSAPLLNYTNAIAGAWTPPIEADLTNVSPGSIGGGGFIDPVVISRNIQILTDLVNTYKNAVTLSVTANNVFGATAPFVVTPIQSIVDGPSEQLVYHTYPQSILSLSDGVSVLGFRIQSGVAGAADVPPFTNGAAIWANSVYDNTADISSLQELQISNGQFTTPAAELYSYKNYTTYKYTDTLFNTVNYSSISTAGFRYASFAWDVPPAPTTSYINLSFTLTSSVAISVINNLACVGGTPIQFYYRYEEAASPTPTGLASLTSAWINGNSTTGTQTGSGNYYLPLTYTSTPNWGLTAVTQNGNATTITVQITPLRIVSGAFHIYARIGLPMNVPFSFSTVSAKISS